MLRDSLEHTVLHPYTRNSNTGNKYEIQIILFMLRQMGLTDERMDAMRPLFMQIKARNSKVGVPSYIDGVIAYTRGLSVGDAFLLKGKRIVDLRSTTQDDSDGKTADVIAIAEDGEEFGISICGGKCPANGSVEKCLSNPSAKRMGATAADISRIKERQALAVRDYKAFMTTTYGAEESAWPSRLKTTVAVEAASDVARLMEERFASLSADQKTAVFRDLLRIDDVSLRPADFLAIAISEPRFSQKFYAFNDPVFPRWEPQVRADGIWLRLSNCGVDVGHIQVKFNNGVYHNGKTSSLYSSWNLTVNLRTIFRLEDTA